MGRGDFNLDNNYFTDEDTNFNNLNTPNVQNNTTEYFMGNGDFSHIGINEPNSVVGNENVVYDENQYATTHEKFKYFLSTLNKSILAIIGSIILILSIIVIMIIVRISSINASYKTEIEIPDLIYLDEASSVKITAKGKKELDKTETTFKVYKYDLKEEEDYDNMNKSQLEDKARNEGISDIEKETVITLRNKLYEKSINKKNLNDKKIDNQTLSVIENTVKGKNTNNTLIPIQEGRAIIKVESNLGKRKMADFKKKITVCPAFNNSLIYGNAISIIEGYEFKPEINFGLGNCSEDIEYKSSNEEIFKVSEDGKLEALKKGTAILTISKGIRNFTVPVYITSDFVKAKTIKVKNERLQLVPEQNTRIEILVNPVNATSQNFVFKTSDNEIAEVDKYGLITAKKQGEVEIECLSERYISNDKIKVIVSKKTNSEGKDITGLNLETKEVTLLQGATSKIKATVMPENASNKTLHYESDNTQIVSVNENGVMLAKNVGETTIAITTANNIQKILKVKIEARKKPIAKTSDSIKSGNWHNKPFTINLSGADSGSEYYYGTSESKINKKGKTIKIEKDQEKAYYIKACKENVCSEITKYTAMLDTVKPKVTATLKGNNAATIVAEDETSKVSQLCALQTDDSSECKWFTIKPENKPVKTYTAKKNGTYYIFAKDKAGNISDASEFAISGIED